MIFTKMQGAGNDFIVIDNRDGRLTEAQLPALAARVCSRRLSVGADGMMIVERPTVEDADLRMRFYNSDGSVGEMCGNGARCICRYAYEKGLAGETQRVETTAGLVVGTRIDARRYRVRLNDITRLDEDLRLEALGETYTVQYVEMGCPGLPHAVVEVPGLAGKTQEELLPLGRALRRHPAFPKGANINFYEILGEDRLAELTFERGVEGFTLACGTGTGSTVSVLARKGLVSGRDVRVTMPGGELSVTVDVSGALPRDILLTGPTNIVAEGELLDEDLSL